MALASLSQRGGVEILRIAMCGARGVQRCCHLRCSSSGSSGSSSSHPMPDGLTVSASAASPPPPPTPASRLQQQPHQPASAPPPPPRLSQNCRFCRSCGGSMHIVQPEGDKAWRHVCKECGYIDYVNPKLVVGCIVEHAGKILLCRRAIEPCRGLWTLPAGFLEVGESSAAGAARETLEEAGAQVQIIAPFAHLDIPMIGQAYLLFRARLAPPYTFSAGEESLEVALFDPSDVPFADLAFSSISVTLRHYVAEAATGDWHVHHGVIDKRPGSAPNDPTSFELREHFALPLR